MRKHWLGGFLLAGLAAAVGWGAGYAQADAQQKAMVYELRTYTTLDGRLDALNARFRDYTMKLFEKHGMKNVIYLTPIDKPNTLVYLLAHKSKEAASESFKAFRADAEWNAAREASEKDGKIVEKVESVFLNPTDYSPMK